MLAKKLAALLLKHPNMEVEIGSYSYASSEDSVGYFDFIDVEVVSIRKDNYYDAIILTSTTIGYPQNPANFEIIS